MRWSHKGYSLLFSPSPPLRTHRCRISRLERLGPRAARLVGPGGQDLGRLAVDEGGKVSGDALGKLPLHAARLGQRVRIEVPSGLAPEVAEKVAVLLRQSGSQATIAPLTSA